MKISFCITKLNRVDYLKFTASSPQLFIFLLWRWVSHKQGRYIFAEWKLRNGNKEMVKKSRKTSTASDAIVDKQVFLH